MTTGAKEHMPPPARSLSGGDARDEDEIPEWLESFIQTVWDTACAWEGDDADDFVAHWKQYVQARAALRARLAQQPRRLFWHTDPTHPCPTCGAVGAQQQPEGPMVPERVAVCPSCEEEVLPSAILKNALFCPNGCDFGGVLAPDGESEQPEGEREIGWVVVATRLNSAGVVSSIDVVGEVLSKPTAEAHATILRDDAVPTTTYRVCRVLAPDSSEAPTS